MSAPRRLPAVRVARVGGWTALAVAGATAVLARFPLGAAPAQVPAAVTPPAGAEVTTTTGAALPAPPPRGLLILYLSPSPGVPVVTGTLPTTTAPAAPAATTTTTVAAPPPVVSSGS